MSNPQQKIDDEFCKWRDKCEDAIQRGEVALALFAQGGMMAALTCFAHATGPLKEARFHELAAEAERIADEIRRM